MTTDDANLAEKIRHLSTTAKVPHEYEYFHDTLGFNYRMPNINACLGLGQLTKLGYFVANKRLTAKKYASFFENYSFKFWVEKAGCKSNYWLNAVSFKTEEQKEFFLKRTNAAKVMTRPVWVLLDKLPHLAGRHVICNGNAEKIYKTTVNIPSSVTHLE